MLLYCITSNSHASAPPPLTITEIERLDFGTAIQETNTLKSIEITPHSTVGTSTTATIIGYDGRAGRYLIRGSDTHRIHVDITSNSSDFSSFSGIYNHQHITFPAGHLNPPTSLGTELRIGATLSVTPNTDINQPHYTINVMYE